MTSQLVQQTITLQILLNISQSKDNQTKKFGQLLELSKRNNSFKIIQKMRQ